MDEKPSSDWFDHTPEAGRLRAEAARDLFLAGRRRLVRWGQLAVAGFLAFIGLRAHGPVE